MARYALASGFSVAPTVIRVVEQALAADRSNGRLPWPPLQALTAAHDVLSKTVAPATPRTILLLSQRPRVGLLSVLGPVRLVRHMLLAAVSSIALFILLAMSPDVNTRSGDIFHSSGLTVLLNLLFFLVAGGIGAAFAQLFKAYRYIADGTYDPKYEASYWVRFILGLIAGVVLPALVPLGQSGGSSFTKPLLALLGGFSAAVLYRILERLVLALESVVRGDGRQELLASEAAAAARAAETQAQERMTLYGDLSRLKTELVANGGGDANAEDTLDRILQSLQPAGTGALDGVPVAAEETDPVEETTPDDAPAATTDNGQAEPAA
ncbi:MAG TPA: hypothetical protein VGF23_14195 [Gaiellaceae bacterium]|jgi:uncharacterized membrane protein